MMENTQDPGKDPRNGVDEAHLATIPSSSPSSLLRRRWSSPRTHSMQKQWRALTGLARES